jgi:hypothetical protein
VSRLKKKRKYTEAIHAKRLMAILEEDDVCACCPAADGYLCFKSPHTLWLKKTDPCRICAEFIGKTSCRCPCFILGKEKAIELTIQALKEKGYM